MRNSFSYLILPDLKLMLCYYEGNIGLAEIMQSNLDLMSDPSYNPGYDVIMDFRSSIALAFSFESVGYVEFLKKTLRIKQTIRIGCLLTTPNQKFMFYILQPLIKVFHIDGRNFIKLTDCLEWFKYSNQEQILIKESLNSLKANQPHTIFSQGN